MVVTRSGNVYVPISYVIHTNLNENQPLENLASSETGSLRSESPDIDITRFDVVAYLDDWVNQASQAPDEQAHREIAKESILECYDQEGRYLSFQDLEITHLLELTSFLPNLEELDLRGTEIWNVKDLNLGQVNIIADPEFSFLIDSWKAFLVKAEEIFLDFTDIENIPSQMIIQILDQLSPSCRKSLLFYFLKDLSNRMLDVMNSKSANEGSIESCIHLYEILIKLAAGVEEMNVLITRYKHEFEGLEAEFIDIQHSSAEVLSRVLVSFQEEQEEALAEYYSISEVFSILAEEVEWQENWFEILSDLDKALEDTKEPVILFLQQLGSSPNFTNPALIKNSLNKLILIFEQMIRDDLFKDKSLEIMEDMNSSCDDRALIGLNQLWIAYQLTQLNQEEDSNVVKFLIGAKRIDLILDILRTKNYVLRNYENFNDYDENIETLLAVQLKLKNELGLPLASQEMAHETYWSQLLPEIVEDVKVEVLKCSENLEDQVGILLESSEWKDRLDQKDDALKQLKEELSDKSYDLAVKPLKKRSRRSKENPEDLRQIEQADLQTAYNNRITERRRELTIEILEKLPRRSKRRNAGPIQYMKV